MNSFKRVLSTVLAVAATVTVGYLTISGELDLAARLAGVIVVLLVLLAYLFGLFAQPPEPKNLCDIARQLGDQIDGLWGPEASNRRIYQHHFVPVQLYQCTKHRSALQHVSSRAWKATEYQDALVSLVHRKGVRRAVILGEPGLGKSTLALMLLLGLRATDPDCLPLLLSVGSWDMDAERFHSWLDRQLAINYRAVNAMGDDRIKQLVYSDQVLIILDGLDGLGEANLARAIAQINETIPSDRPTGPSSCCPDHRRQGSWTRSSMVILGPSSACGPPEPEPYSSTSASWPVLNAHWQVGGSRPTRSRRNIPAPSASCSARRSSSTWPCARTDRRPRYRHSCTACGTSRSHWPRRH